MTYHFLGIRILFGAFKIKILRIWGLPFLAGCDMRDLDPSAQ